MDGMRLAPRRKLGELIVTGSRKKVRDGIRIAVLATVAMAVLGLLLESHRECLRWHSSSSEHEWGPAHRFLGETGIWPLVVLGVIGLGQWWAHTGGMALAIVLAVIDVVLAAVVTLSFAFVHLLSHVDHDSAGSVLLPIALLAALALSLVQLVIEPWVAINERRIIERTDPVFPSAIVVRSR